MSKVSRLCISLVFLVLTIWAVNAQLKGSTAKLAEGAIQNGVNSFVDYHSKLIADDPRCADFRIRIQTVKSQKTMDTAGPMLMKLNGDAKGAGCLK
jgi:hypothetical protein